MQNYRNGITKEEVRKLIGFLQGGKQRGTTWDLEFQTERSNATLNNYLSVYRDFYNEIFNIKDSSPHSKSAVAIHSGRGFMSHANKKVEQRFDVSKKVKRDERPPKYIKEREYEAIIELIKKKYSLRDTILVELMYKYGLRLGEALGLTFKDITQTNSGKDCLVIRNRVSDKPWQSGKSVMNPRSRHDYGIDAYAIEGMGYQIVVIEKEMAELIYEYIDESRDEVLLNKSKAKRINLETKCIADKVTDRDDLIDGNYYIFLNRQHCTPLTASGWNYTVRKVFQELDIKLDKSVKENNLSHRFRHGFAMKKVQEGYTELQLADALRHSGTLSVKKYYNPDDEDRTELLERQREHMNKGAFL